jgi:hypothetical protein
VRCLAGGALAFLLVLSFDRIAWADELPDPPCDTVRAVLGAAQSANLEYLTTLVHPNACVQLPGRECVVGREGFLRAVSREPAPGRLRIASVECSVDGRLGFVRAAIDQRALPAPTPMTLVCTLWHGADGWQLLTMMPVAADASGSAVQPTPAPTKSEAPPAG